MPLLVFSLFSAFSGQTVYDIYMLQIFNVVFTSIPIFVYAVLDWERPKADLVA